MAISSVMSWAKVPCILVAMVGLQIAVTPPHPAPPSGEKVASTSLEVILKERSGPVLVKGICWAAAIAEAVVVVASHNSHWRISRIVLEKLVFEGSPDSIRLTPLFLLGTSMTAFGGFIRWRCYRELGKLFTFEMSIRKNHKLVMSGPYAVVRHPGYTGILFTIVGIVCWHASPGSWARECGALGTIWGRAAAGTYLTLVGTITTGLLSRMSKEDEALAQEFGSEWYAWAKRVPYKLIPWVF